MIWKKAKLGDICETTSGGTPNRSTPSFWGGKIPWLKSGELNDTFVESAEEYITNEGLKNSSAKLFPKGTLLLALYGVTAGKLGILNFDSTTNQALCAITPKNGDINNKFLMYFLLSKRRQIIKDSFGGAQPNISQSYVRNLFVPIPPTSTQQKIALVLDKADELRKKDQLLLAKYDELLQSVFYDMFGDNIDNGKTSLSDIVEINPRKSEINVSDNLEVSFVPMAAVGEDGEFDCSSIKTFGQVKTGFTYFRENDVLFAKITPCMENGKGAIAKGLKNKIGFGSTEFHVLRPNEKMYSEFIFSLLNQKHVRAYAEANMTGSAGQKRVPTDFFKKLKITLPPITLQNQFAAIAQNIQQQKQQVKQQIEESENLFQNLLQRAFKGELVV